MCIRHKLSRILRSTVARHETTQQASVKSTTENVPMAEVRFDDPKEIYRSKTTAELIRSALILKLCSIELLTRNSERLMNIGRLLLGKSLFKILMKNTIYGQFIAAENFKQLKPEVEKLERNGIRSILDYCIEKDINQRQAKGITEASLEQSLKIILESIDMATAVKGNLQMVAVKVTSITEPLFLAKLNDVIEASQQFLEELYHDSWDNIVQIKTSVEELMTKVKMVRRNAERINSQWIEYVKESADTANKRTDFSKERHFDQTLSWEQFSGAFMPPEKQKAPAWTRNDYQQYKALVGRLSKIADYAATKRVPVMIDAEQTYFQAAIDYLSYSLMRIYNREMPLIIPTYQAYLKNAMKRVKTGLNLSRIWNYYFAAKLVRGAYMDTERARAKELNYEDPINESYEATNQMYNSIINVLFQESKQSSDGKVWFMCATHNEESIRKLLTLLSDPTAKDVKKRLAFGQLYGMFDHLSFPLAQAGYTVYKYVPFGPLELTLPYLVRRAQENSSTFHDCKHQIGMMRQEIARRRSRKK
ncbi:unnamed protein product [Soboliphyme baturini]|uniref:Proline dehydrogenase n=1 Tax=Soboliphyme baturini TaxID=241478 RepID=A0A183ISU3_9BILA|nr:unnamed protein product [Soboliphyme baturini]